MKSTPALFIVVGAIHLSPRMRPANFDTPSILFRMSQRAFYFFLGM
jgi:hypothetical protein